MNRYSCVCIFGFMVQELQLRGDELLLYAYVFAMTQMPDTYCVLDYRKISDSIGLSYVAIDVQLRHLEDKGLIEVKNKQARAISFD